MVIDFLFEEGRTFERGKSEKKAREREEENLSSL
jgi:hypothetical protein